MEKRLEMSDSIEFAIEDGEFWWCGVTDLSSEMPYTETAERTFDMLSEPMGNHMNPVFFSSNGRWAWMPGLGKFCFSAGKLRLDSPEKIESGREKTLKEACLKVAAKYYPTSGKEICESVYRTPQYCTWMELLYDQNQESILRYARDILKTGLPPGELIIDDGWQDYYGAMEFNRSKFPDPQAMCRELREMGFTVSLWVVPYVSADSVTYRYLLDRGMLVTESDGEPFLSKWWNGYSALIDFGNPASREWFCGKYRILKEKYGILGLKMDGGDVHFAPQYASGCLGCTPQEHCRLYASLGGDEFVKELRACIKNAGMPFVARVSDRRHSWDRKNGVAGLIERMTLLGMIGYYYACPDMIGGGLIDDYKEKVPFGAELLKRFMQVSAFMPIMQFSKIFWKHDEKLGDMVRRYTAVHISLMPYLQELFKNAAKNGEPVVRSIFYEFNVRADINDEFLLGDRYLIAPILKAGETERTIYLPEGKWKSMLSDHEYCGPTEISEFAGTDDCSWFERIE